ncbi:zinc ribbon domain-containing protein [Methanobrevibacter sp.]|uniref:double zinc ribbon domain-containing protein n=1 Tax=Methanobrevibacter sp. TaxID=66852 RepID=UPI0025FFCDA1|nr:zinc ribbon domain-containing protein [Methanobrevibacter sp.]MBQ2831473.1 zinc ribbon domain-containing protein [Methanobrevibacter sp.]
MAKFCPHCGHEQENPDNKFCSKCGGSMDNTQQAAAAAAPTMNNAAGSICKVCKSVIPAGQVVCPNCGSPVVQDTHTAAIVIGYISAIVLTLLIGIFGVIITVGIGIYLYTRDNEDVHKHGLIIIAISVIIFVIWILFVFALASSYHSTYYYY